MMSNNELYHHGILGQKWGVRRFQNEDGSLTEAGRKRYGVSGERNEMSTREKMRKWLANNAKKREAEKKIKAKENEKKKAERAAAKQQKQEAKTAAERAQLMKDALRDPEKLSQLTDDELKSVLNRMNLERMYVQNMDSMKREKAESTIQKIVKATGTAATLANNVANIKGSIERLKSDPLAELKERNEEMRLQKEYEKMKNNEKDPLDTLAEQNKKMEIIAKNKNLKDRLGLNGKDSEKSEEKKNDSASDKSDEKKRGSASDKSDEKKSDSSPNLTPQQINTLSKAFTVQKPDVGKAMDSVQSTFQKWNNSRAERETAREEKKKEKNREYAEKSFQKYKETHGSPYQPSGRTLSDILNGTSYNTSATPYPLTLEQFFVDEKRDDYLYGRKKKDYLRGYY